MKESCRKALRKIKLLGFVRKVRELINSFYTELYFIAQQVKLRMIITKLDRKKTFKEFQKLVYVSPNQINYVTKDWPMDKHDVFFISSADKKGLITSENWTENRRAHITTTIRHIFVENKSYRDSAQYIMIKENLERNYGYTYHCKTVSDLDNYFENLYKSYYNIRDGGYKTQQELMEETPELIQTIDNQLRENDEIKVYIGEHGDLILARGGTHRLLISKLLELKEIPVLIVGINISWLIKTYKKSESRTNTSRLIRALLTLR